MSLPRRTGVMVCVAVLVLAVISPAIAGQPGNYRDEFKSASYDGSDGSLAWEDGWLEVPLANGPLSGTIQVVSSDCEESYCLRIGPGNVAGQGVTRDVDLAGAGSVTLTLSSRRVVPGGGSGVRAYIAISEDGWKWTSVEDIVMDASDPDFVDRTIDLSAWAGSEVKVGIFGTGVFAGQLLIDDVDILLSANTPPVFDSSLPDRHDQEGDSVTFAVEASDPDGGGLTFSATGLPPGVAINPETGVITGTIAANAAGQSPYSSVVKAQDAAGAVASAQFRWSVVDLNRPPTLAPIADISVAELTPVAVQVSADDPDLPDDELSFSLVEAPSGVTINSSGVVRWTPGESAGPGTASVTVRVEDSANPSGSAQRTFEINVTEVNQAPTLNHIPDFSLRPGDEVDYQIDYSDSDRPRNSLTISATGLPPGITLDAATGEMTGRIPSDANPASGTAVVTVRDDGSPAATAIQTFSWQVGTGNRAPLLSPIPDPELTADGYVRFIADAEDSDPDDVLSYWLAAGIDPIPDGATIDTETGEFAWQPEQSQFDQTYRINVGVSDSGSPRLSATQLVTIALPEYNLAPALESIDDQSSAEGESVAIQLAGTDPNTADTLRYAATGLPAGLSIDAESGLISGEISYDAADSSPFSVTVNVSDDGLPEQTAERSFLWTVADTNRAPEVTALSVVVLVDLSRAIVLPVIDPDGDELTFTISDQPTLGTVDGIGPEITYTGSAAGLDQFRFTADDGEFKVEGLVTVEVRLSNEAPVAGIDQYESGVDELLTVEAPGVLSNDTDADGEPLQAVVIAPPDSGQLTLEADGSFSYQPNSGFSGLDKFTYAAVDALDERATATVVIVVGVDAGAPATEDDTVSRAAILAATTPSWTPPTPGDSSMWTTARHTAGAVAGGLLAMLNQLRFPIMLLAAMAALALAFGRVSLFGGGKIEGEGRLDAFDSSGGLGRIIPDGSDGAVFVPESKLRVGFRPGQRVEYVASSIRGKLVAVEVWPAT